MKNQSFSIQWWVKGDLNAFFGLGMNSLLNLLVLSGLLINVIQLPHEIVFGRILPGIGLMLAISNLYYAWMAAKLSKQELRNNVASLPAGPSVPHMFFVTFAIMLPVKVQTGDPILAWQTGMAWVFIEGLVNLLGAFVAPTIKKYTPRAALLGTLAGVSLVFIALQPTMQMLEEPIIGMFSLTIIFCSWFAYVKIPFNIPAILIVVIFGTILGWIMGLMDVGLLVDSIETSAFHTPQFAVSGLVAGLSTVAPLLVTAIPFGIYDFVEALDNVESASAAGDNYSVKEVLLVDGSTSLIGTFLGSPFANAVYIGHPGWKNAGGRIGYSIATGLLVLIVTWFGVIPIILNLVPLVAIVPILLYIGVLISSQAFQSVSKALAPAIVIAMIPHFGAWGLNLVDNALALVGVVASDFEPSSFSDAGIMYAGLQILGGGAILIGLIWGAITTSIIEKSFTKAAVFALWGAGLTFFGFMHSSKIEFASSIEITAGYLLMAVILYLFSLANINTKTEAN